MQHEEKIDLFELIESYLNKDLSDEKRREFERRMAEDEAFRQEVELHRGLQENFSDSGRWRLRSTLTEVMKENPQPDETSFISKPGFSKIRWIVVIFFGIVLIGIVIWYLLQSSPGHPIRESIESQPGMQPSITVPGVESDTASLTVPKESIPQQQQSEENMLFAEADPADFSPNTSMEAFINSGVRSFEGLTFRMTSPANSAVFTPDKKGETIIRFSGLLEGISEEATPECVLSIFNNKNVSQPLVSVSQELKKDALGYIFEMRQRLKFPLGLYYFTLEHEGEILYTGKFSIGQIK